MATRAIVTSHPVVACDVCGRRLLRGETPDVFLAGGQRRTVCELCVPRAAAEGWRRETDEHELSLRPSRRPRRGSLLGRLRQLREGEEPLRRPPAHGHRRDPLQEAGLYESEDPLYDYLEGSSTPAEVDSSALYIGTVAADDPALSEEQETSVQTVEHEAVGLGGETQIARALEVFNGGETAQRIAGVSRSLGAPTVVVRAVEGSATGVRVLVAWELCWYRYEVDLSDEAAGTRLIGEGMELDELAAEDRAANAFADERGRIALSLG